MNRLNRKSADIGLSKLCTRYLKLKLLLHAFLMTSLNCSITTFLSETIPKHITHIREGSGMCTHDVHLWTSNSSSLIYLNCAMFIFTQIKIVDFDERSFHLSKLWCTTELLHLLEQVLPNIHNTFLLEWTTLLPRRTMFRSPYSP